ncbi:fibronectin type III domain-containing protein [Patescibacteria group bacterium]|nr:fibronectin type III domain-containing protein [Patescibacteria group bacterium]
MINFFNKFKIPTLLGLGIILLGTISGFYLVLREQVFLSQAAPNLTPQNIAITNIADDSAVISWQTKNAANSFITYGQNNPGEQTALDNRDGDPTEPNDTGLKPRLTHYVTLKNLLPGTSYLFKITSGKLTSEVMKFNTANPLVDHTRFTPIIGSVVDGNNPLNDGVVYLSIQGAVTQSSLIKTGGNFLIPISQIRKADLSDIFPLTEELIAKLTINSDKGNASVIFNLQNNPIPLPSIKLGQDLDLTIPFKTPTPSSTIKDLDKYDLNNDGKINAADHAIVLQNFGKNPKDKKADLNEDGVVDQKDLYLMAQKTKELGSQ